MANLNFQQPPRSYGSSLSNRGTTGFSSSLSGHVTPTSGMFPISNAFNTQQQSNQSAQLSPNRNSQYTGTIGSNNSGQILSATRSSNIINQRNFDRRTMSGMPTGPVTNMGTFMPSRAYGSQGINNMGGFHSVFGSSVPDTGTPPLLDLSEFPSLTNARGQNELVLPISNSMQTPGNKPYVGMVKQPTSEQTEFTMSNEDFPALPGTQAMEGSSNNALSSNIEGAEKLSGVGGGMSMAMDLQADAGLFNEKAMKRGVQTSPDGKVTNIPASMVNNQFGMVGLLTFIRAAESDPNLVSLAMGQDLTALGLNLNSSENLYPSFGGPFCDAPARPQDIDFNVPPEYLINSSIKEKLSPVTLKKYKDDLLFFLFYTNVGEFIQLSAAAELYNRDWRYHTEEKVWITRMPGITTTSNGSTERGTFYYFDAQNWRRVPKEFQIDTQKLDKCPNITGFVNLSGFIG
ncbi:regulator of gene activity [Culicoides brevitarsis]|uniref:regulator of gene activity n=1 Tax=Culicoides brevitarsis TaxID=469753 RepID=UPI00307CB2ED